MIGKKLHTCCPTYNSDRKIQKHKIRRIDFQTRNSSNAFIAHRGDYFFFRKNVLFYRCFFIQLKMFQSNDLLQEISHDFLFTQKLFKLHVSPVFSHHIHALWSVGNRHRLMLHLRAETARCFYLKKSPRIKMCIFHAGGNLFCFRGPETSFQNSPNTGKVDYLM